MLHRWRNLKLPSIVHLFQSTSLMDRCNRETDLFIAVGRIFLSAQKKYSAYRLLPDLL